MGGLEGRLSDRQGLRADDGNRLVGFGEGLRKKERSGISGSRRERRAITSHVKTGDSS